MSEHPVCVLQPKGQRETGFIPVFLLPGACSLLKKVTQCFEENNTSTFEESDASARTIPVLDSVSMDLTKKTISSHSCLYDCTENVASGEDLPNFFCKHWNILLKY